MPRCLICDDCSETDGGSEFHFHYVEEEKGYICNDCSTEVSEAISDFGYDELEGLTILEEPGLEEPSTDVGESKETGNS